MLNDGKEMIELSLKSKDDIYASYMGFVKDGALFIHTKKKYELGDSVTVKLDLMDEPEIIEFKSEVVWLTPIGAQGGMSPGIGVRFSGDIGSKLNKKITTYLAGMERSEKRTDTL